MIQSLWVPGRATLPISNASAPVIHPLLNAPAIFGCRSSVRPSARTERIVLTEYPSSRVTYDSIETQLSCLNNARPATKRSSRHSCHAMFCPTRRTHLILR